ncbi:MAG: restriction endonuclease [Firmicutes bacterium]|nr:restriction endonuclease [Bacillota bacterium]
MAKDKPLYYVQNPARDNRTRLARGIDILLSLALAWLPAVLAVGALPLAPLFSGLLTVLMLALGTALVAWYHTRKSKALQLHRDTWYSARKCREKLKEMVSSREYARLVKELLEGSLPFTGLKVLAPDDNSAINLSGYVRSRRVAVMCVNPGTDDHKTTMEEIERFLTEIRQAGFDSGMVVSTGSFSDEARRFVRRFSGRTKIGLMDGYAVLRLAKKTGHPVFPDEKWREEKENRISGLEMALSIKDNLMASRRKGLSFVFLGIVFVVISALQEGFIGSVYLAVGVINLFTGFSGLILSYLRKQELFPDWL